MTVSPSPDAVMSMPTYSGLGLTSTASPPLRRAINTSASVGDSYSGTFIQPKLAPQVPRGREHLVLGGVVGLVRRVARGFCRNRTHMQSVPRRIIDRHPLVYILEARLDPRPRICIYCF